VDILVIRFTLLLIPVAIAYFMLAVVFQQLMMTELAGLLSQIGSLVLLCAFSAVLLAVLGAGIHSLALSVCHYFSHTPRMERKIMFYKNKYEQLSRLFLFKQEKVRYFSRQQRKRLSIRMDKTA
jgi:hypothetical protein